MKYLVTTCAVLATFYGATACNAQPPQNTKMENTAVALTLVNPDFEQVDGASVPGWSLSPQATSSTEYAIDGTRSLKVVANNADDNQLATQGVTRFEKGRRYRVQYRVRCDKFGTEYRVYIGMWRQNGAKTDWVSGADTQWRQGLADWQKVAFDFVPADAADSLQVVLQVKGPGTAWFDALSIAPAPDIKAPPPIAPFVGSPQFVQITANGRFRVAGKPFYPLMLWGRQTDSDDLMQQARAIGYNIVAPGVTDELGVDGVKNWLDMAQRNKMMVMLPLNFTPRDETVAPFLETRLPKNRAIFSAIKNHPALFVYNVADEPAWGGTDLDAFATGAKAIRELDPNHPIFVNHAPRNTIKEIGYYNAYIDITGSDIYPVYADGIDKHSDLPNETLSVVGDEVVKNLEAAASKKPVIQTLQAFAWSEGKKDEAPQPFPDAAQLRFMAYDSIAAGANGIAFFQDHRYPNVRTDTKPILTELRSLSRVLASGSDLDAKTLKVPAGIRLRAFRSGGHLVLLATNMTAQPISISMNLAALNPRRETLRVLFENRATRLNQKVLQETLPPFSARLFTDAARDSDVLQTP